MQKGTNMTKKNDFFLFTKIFMSLDNEKFREFKEGGKCDFNYSIYFFTHFFSSKPCDK